MEDVYELNFGIYVQDDTTKIDASCMHSIYGTM